MAEVSPVTTKPEGFTTIKYTTKDGEHVSATKNNGIVTIVGDKNGVRQMPIQDFMEELKTNLANVQLEKTPNKDTVELSTAKKEVDTKKTEDKKPAAKEETKESAKPEEKTTQTNEKKLDVAA